METPTCGYRIGRRQIYYAAAQSNDFGGNRVAQDAFFDHLMNAIISISNILVARNDAFNINEAELAVLERVIIHGAAVALQQGNPVSYTTGGEFPGSMYEMLWQSTEVIRQRLVDFRAGPNRNYDHIEEQLINYRDWLEEAGVATPQRLTSNEDQDAVGRISLALGMTDTRAPDAPVMAQVRRDFVNNAGGAPSSFFPSSTYRRRAWNSYFGVVGEIFEGRGEWFPHSNNHELRSRWNQIWGQHGIRFEARRDFVPYDFLDRAWQDDHEDTMVSLD